MPVSDNVHFIMLPSHNRQNYMFVSHKCVRVAWYLVKGSAPDTFFAAASVPDWNY